MTDLYGMLASLCVGIIIGLLIAHYYPTRTLFIRSTFQPGEFRSVMIQEWSLDHEHWREAQRAWSKPHPTKEAP